MAKSFMMFFAVYYVVIGLILFAMMGIDKAKAKKGLWRIPEPTLLTISVMGGAFRRNFRYVCISSQDT